MKVTNTTTARAAKSTLNGASHPKVETVKAAQAEHLDPSSLDDEGVMNEFMHAAERLLARMGAVSWKRRACAYVTAFILGAGIGYLGGTLINMMMMSAAVLATPVFVQFLLFALAFLATVWVASKVGGYVGGAILDGSLDRAISSGVKRVAGWFSFGSASAAA